MLESLVDALTVEDAWHVTPLAGPHEKGLRRSGRHHVRLNDDTDQLSLSLRLVMTPTAPTTLLPTGCLVENGLTPEARLRLYELEAHAADCNTFTALVRADRPAPSLSAATEGDLDRSRRQRELRRPQGFGDELRAVLTDATGTWGALTLLRDADRPEFTAPDVEFVDVSAAGMRGLSPRRAAAPAVTPATRGRRGGPHIARGSAATGSLEDA